MSKSKVTVIQEGTEFDGCVISECDITLNGKLKGEVCAPSLVVEVSGTVDGRVKVTELRSRGSISGDIEAETVELSGTVSDQTVIRANSLEVKLSQPDSGMQVMFGDCELQVGQIVSSGSSKSKSTPDELVAMPELAKADL